MAVKPIIVFGGGGHGKVLLGMLSRMKAYKVLGYVDLRDNGPVLGFKRLGGDEVLPALVKKHKRISVALGVGKVRAESNRLQIAARLKALGFSFPALVAPSAVVAKGVVLGEGTVVMDRAVVQPGCAVGSLGIVNTGVLLDHDCVLGDDVHLATGATLSGGVSMGSGGMVGTGAAVIQGVRIVEGCMIGAGAAVVEDCLEPGTYVGVPARRIG